MEDRIRVTIAPTMGSTWMLATYGSDELLRARLGPPSQVHRWAAPTFLEGLSLWHQRQLRVVLFAESEAISSGLHLSDGFGFGLSTLHYEVEVIEHRGRWRGEQPGGISSFGELRQFATGGWR